LESSRGEWFSTWSIFSSLATLATPAETLLSSAPAARRGVAMFPGSVHVREQREVLEGHAHAAMFGRDVGNIVAGDLDGARGRFLHARDQPQQDGLAGAGAAEDHHDLAGLGCKVQPVEDLEGAIALRERLDFKLAHPFTAPMESPSTR
jgi:hypothetical protein